MTLGAVACDQEPQPLEARVHLGEGSLYTNDASFTVPERTEPRASDGEAELSLTTGVESSQLLFSRDLECEVFAANGGSGADPVTVAEFVIPVSDFINEPIFFFNESVPELGYEVVLQTAAFDPGPFKPLFIAISVVDTESLRLVSAGLGQFSRIYMSPDLSAIQTGFQPEGGLEIDGETFDQLLASCSVVSALP